MKFARGPAKAVQICSWQICLSGIHAGHALFSNIGSLPSFLGVIY